MPGTIRFGTDGWRGVLADTFTFDNARRVTQAIADHLEEAGLSRREVLVGYDTRFMAEHFAEEVACVLAGNNLAVGLSSTDVPTPVLAHAVLRRRAAGAIMLTASHNPPHYLGLKFIPHYGGPAMSDVTASIEAHIHRVEQAVRQGQLAVRRADLAQARRQGLVELTDLRLDYMSQVLAVVGSVRAERTGLPIVYDAMFGTGRLYVPEGLENLGFVVERLHAHRDPLFGGGAPEPTAEHLGELQERIKAAAAGASAARRGGATHVLGLATDGDADRFGVVDVDGTYLSPNQVLSVLADHLLRERGMRGSIVRTVATTHLLDRIAAEHGVTVRETPVGFKYVGEWMRKEPVVLGGEESGGLSMAGHIPEKDGILAVLTVAYLWSREPQALGERLRAIEERVGPAVSRRIDLPLASLGLATGATANAATVVERLSRTPPDRFAERRVERVILLDGVKAVLEDGSWWLVRASGTEPLVRLYLEAPGAARLQEMARALQALVAESL